jgi:hypothetical protein
MWRREERPSLSVQGAEDECGPRRCVMRQASVVLVVLAATAVHCGPPGQVKVAIELMNSEEPAQRAAGARELRELADKGTRGIDAALPALLNVIYQPDHERKQFDSGEVWSAHGEALKVFKRVPIESLLRLVASETFYERFAAVTVAGKLKEPRAVEALIQALGDSHDGFRRNAIQALGEIGDARAVPALVDLAKREDYTALEALGNFKDPRSVDALVGVLRDSKDAFHVWTAGASLQKIGGDPKAVDPLLALVHGPELERFPEKDRGRLQDRAAVCLRADGYKKARVVERLIAVLGERGISTSLRADVGDTLMELTGHSWAPADGVWTKEDEYPRDPKKWSEWWATHKAGFQ